MWNADSHFFIFSPYQAVDQYTGKFCNTHFDRIGYMIYDSNATYTHILNALLSNHFHCQPVQVSLLCVSAIRGLKTVHTL